MRVFNKFKVVAWNIGIIDESVESILSSGVHHGIHWMKHDYHDRFFADPFLLDRDERCLYILAEEYLFAEGKGRIVKLTVDAETKELLDVKRMIDSKYHLSYPFFYKGEIIAEQARSGKWIAYDTNGKESRVLSNIGLIDSTIFCDGNKEWVFATKVVSEKGDALRKLYRYELVDGTVNEQSEMLIKDNYTASRPAGIFFYVDGYWYRAAQNSTESVYGESVTICRITENTENRFLEEPIMIIDSHQENRYNMGLHTFNPYDGFVVVDGFEMQPHLFQKIKYRIRKK